MILTPPPTFLLHNTHLMRPIFSSSIDTSSDEPSATKGSATPPPSSYPHESTNQTWPISYPLSQANIVFVKPDWSDLEATIKFLRQHPEVAEGIANRQRDVMVTQGYLSQAAETCYWRSLIKAWNKMARTSESGDGGRGYWGDGVRWETFSLTRSTKL